MNDDQATDLIDRLAAQLPRTHAPVPELVEAGRSARRRRRRLVAGATTALVAGVVLGAFLGPRLGDGGDRSDRTDTIDHVSPGEAVVYYLAVEPDTLDAHPAPTRLTARLVDVRNTGNPGLDALSALANSVPEDKDLTNGFNFLRADHTSFIQPTSVTHADGVVTVDLAQDPMDPYPNIDFFGPSGEVITQQLVWTVQTAIGTTDPVRITVRGEPAAGILGHSLDGPVAADPAIVLPPDDPVALQMTVNPDLVGPGQVVTVTYFMRWNRGLAYKLVSADTTDPDLSNPDYYLISDGGTARRSMAWYSGDHPPAVHNIGIGGTGPDRVRIPETAAEGKWLLCAVTPLVEPCAELTVTRNGSPAPDVEGYLSIPLSNDPYPAVTYFEESAGYSLGLTTAVSCPAVVESVTPLGDEALLVKTLPPEYGGCRFAAPPSTDRFPLAGPVAETVKWAVIDQGAGREPVRVRLEFARGTLD